MTDIEKLLSEKNGTKSEVYGQTVDSLIRKRYSLSEELSVLRKKDEHPEEFAAYNAYAEECKIKAKAIVFGEV